MKIGNTVKDLNGNTGFEILPMVVKEFSEDNKAYCVQYDEKGKETGD